MLIGAGVGDTRLIASTTTQADYLSTACQRTRKYPFRESTA